MNADATREILYLSRRECEDARPSFARGLELVRDTLLAADDDAIELPPKPGIHPRPDAFIHAMPAHIRTTDVAGIKWVSGYPDNPALGHPYITGLIILNDAATGLPIAVLDGELVTAYRTACVSGLSMQVLASDPIDVIALSGCGVQGRTHLDLIAELYPGVGEVRLFDALPGVAESVAEQYADRLAVRAYERLEDVVVGADVILTAVAERAEAMGAIIERDWVKRGALQLPLANDFGWTAEALEAADRFFSDDIAQFRSFIERGEMTRSRNLGELHEFRGVLTGRIDGRTQPDQTICAVNLGLGAHDITLADAVVAAARKGGAGVLLAR